MIWPKLLLESVNPDMENRLQSIIDSWAGTPYHIGKCRKGVAVDCIRFVCAIADEMQGTRTEVEALPGDQSMHAPETARSAMRLLMRKFGARRMTSPWLQPGDVVVCGPQGGGPGHALIIGTGGVFHATGGGVERTQLRRQAGHPIFHAVLRVKDRETRWALR